MMTNLRKFYPGAKPKQKSYHLGSPVPDDTMVEVKWYWMNGDCKIDIDTANMFDWSDNAGCPITAYKVLTEKELLVLDFMEL